MANEFKIEVHKRELSNKKSDLKSLRKDEKIPGVFYSFDSQKSVPLYIEKKSFMGADANDLMVIPTLLQCYTRILVGRMIIILLPL